MTVPLHISQLVKRSDYVLGYLKSTFRNNKHDSVTSPVLSYELGIRNVPDAIMTLREQGWKIETRMLYNHRYNKCIYRSCAAYRLTSLSKGKPLVLKKEKAHAG